MRIVAALLALLALAAAAPHRDWSNVATRTPSGSFLIGNPQARVKLVEYASYTCPHCAHFAIESAPVLKGRLIRSGSINLEFRHVVFNGLDLGAAILARCTGPRGFAATTELFYRTQDQWLQRGVEFQQANGERLGRYPLLGQLRALADGAGLTATVLARGLSPAAVDACFADEAEVKRIAGMAGDVNSTPTFFLNGKRVAFAGWAALEPQLRAAGAR